MNGADPGRDDGLRVSAFGPATRLTITAPRIDGGLIARLREELASAEADGASAVLIDSEGEAFSLGMDIRSVLAASGSEGTRPVHAAFAALLDAIARYPGLTVAVVDGAALGGGLALVAACDVAIASEAARFGFPEALWGLVPANAAPVVARRTGLATARRLALETEAVSGGEAIRIGLVDALAADRIAAEGIARRHVLRAQRIGPRGLADVKRLFDRLETAPDDYVGWAVDEMAARMDDPVMRERLAETFDNEGGHYGGG